MLPKANVERWRKIGGFYSKDDTRVYYFNRHIKQADCDSFEVVPSDRFQLANTSTAITSTIELNQRDSEMLLRNEFS